MKTKEKKHLIDWAPEDNYSPQVNTVETYAKAFTAMTSEQKGRTSECIRS
jgi:hypothetical protein